MRHLNCPREGQTACVCKRFHGRAGPPPEGQATQQAAGPQPPSALGLWYVTRYQSGPSLTAGLTPYLSHGRNIPMGYEYSYSISYNLITVKAPCEATLTSPTLLLIR